MCAEIHCSAFPSDESRACVSITDHLRISVRRERERGGAHQPQGYRSAQPLWLVKAAGEDLLTSAVGQWGLKLWGYWRYGGGGDGWSVGWTGGQQMFEKCSGAAAGGPFTLLLLSQCSSPVHLSISLFYNLQISSPRLSLIYRSALLHCNLSLSGDVAPSRLPR